ncbi:Bud site selection protein BUD4 [Spathaspora sp. JA1]|nr:Bud site selection protein BUD4 [Spathaspora sp. JA1]
MATTLGLPEEKQSLVDNVSPSPSNHDLFKNENHSVDLLLKEMNLSPEQIADHHDASSIFNSPTKPLNFPRSISKPNIEPKEPSSTSGSDTCASDDADDQVTNNKIPETSFDRNFSLDDSTDVQRTIGKPELDEFSFQTPMTSTTNLLDENKKHEQQDYQQTGSNKSIMKKNNIQSPKKAVAFASATPEVHQYIEESPETTRTENDTSNEQEPQPVQTEWNELHHSSVSEESDTMSAPAPPPPPHTSSTFNELVNNNANLNDDNEQDPQQLELTDLKLKHGNFSNLSLNEKLDLYLSAESNTGSPFQEMDSHLDDLDQAARFKTNSNIQGLSSSIQAPQNVLENPMDTLAKAPDMQLHSGSSQSSLTSLRDDNRKLELRNEQGKRNSGIQLNDGIKGLSDDIVESLIPDNTKELIIRSPSFGIPEDDLNDSFDKSYNHTEQSILNLLNSTSKSYDLDHLNSEKNSNPENDTEQPEGQVKLENEEEIPLKESVKLEPGEDKVNSAAMGQEVVKEENKEVPIKSETPGNNISMNNGLTPQEEVDQLLEQKPSTEEHEQTQDSIGSENSTKMSIRFHMDSDWKLDDSNDGDREDNDATQLDDTTNQSARNEQEDSKSSNDSQDIIPKTLAPPRKDQAVDATNGPSEKANSATDTSSDNVLANSSNIAPPDEITLPVVEQNNYSSFEEITKNMDSMSKSYEDLLSAEHDQEREPANVSFISIWHKHEKQKKHNSSELPKKIQESLEQYKLTTPQVSSNNVRIPSALQTKKFKEVHVMSRKIVNPDFEDLHVSGFLPELSEDSGFEDVRVQANAIMSRRKSSASLSTRDVLASMDTNPHVMEPPQPIFNNGTTTTAKILAATALKLRNRDSDPPHSYLPQAPPSTHSTPQLSAKSRFRVPTFEIKRSGSELAPRNQYNDIFDDIGPKKPTIRADGMKTLPSMDKDDVKMILNARKIMTQDDYARVKLIGPGRLKKNSIVDEADADTSQQASFHELSGIEESNGKSADSTRVLPYLADELKKSPVALLSNDQLFKDEEQQINVSPDPESTIVPNIDFPRLSLEHTPKQNLVSPISSEFDSDSTQVPPVPPHSSHNPFREKRDVTPEVTSAKVKKNPIKIGGSPIKLVKKDGMVTGIEVDNRKSESMFAEQELINNKIRDRVSKEIEKETASIEQAPYKPRMISVNTANSRELPSPQIVDDELPDGEFLERGKLFFRIIGIKNINLPDLGAHPNAKFSITLDNGVHCIRTPDYDLDSRKVPIGKEFELTVGDSLEFILTMKATYDKPKETLVEVTERKTVKPKNRLSRFLGQKHIITTTKFVPKETQDSWKNKFAHDGSFARCYIDLQQYEGKITGKALNFDLNCFNEWEIKDDNTRAPAYKIGQLEVKMLFVPRSNPHEILPTSIRTAYESVNELCRELDTSYEGYLHQEGGDCNVWKRRYFKLQGASMIAHSEYNHKTRAKINLSKVVDVIYVDKENMNPNSSSSNYRNFSDVLLLEHAFKLRFADGEIIDFGAPNKEQKRDWVRILEQIVYRNRFRRQPWVGVMMQATGPNDPKKIEATSMLV